MNFSTYKCIIFDLGAVLLNIDYHLTKQAFEKLGVDQFDALYSKASQTDLFDRLEVGAISPENFRDELRGLIDIELSNAEIDDAWNAMILDFPIERMVMLEELRKTHQLILMSNTNEIHIKAFQKVMEESFGVQRFYDAFDKVYYSSSIGKRKPHPETFQWILNENDLKASDCVFIDDSVQHVEGAMSVGIETVHLTDGLDILGMFG